MKQYHKMQKKIRVKPYEYATLFYAIFCNPLPSVTRNKIMSDAHH